MLNNDELLEALQLINIEFQPKELRLRKYDMDITEPTPLYRKFRLIREVELYSRKEFADLLKAPKKTIESLENIGTDPRGKLLKALCVAMPEYTLWLMTNNCHFQSGQLDPLAKEDFYFWKSEVLGKEKVFDRNDEKDLLILRHIIRNMYLDKLSYESSDNKEYIKEKILELLKE